MAEYYSKLMKALKEGKFVVTGELEPVKTTSLQKIVETAKMLKPYVIAVNVTDNPTSYAYMNSLVPCYIVQREAGVEAIMQVTCRDRNRLAITADLLGAYALGIRNVLALTGDHISFGDNPQAKPVFDLDSTTLTLLLRKMVDEGVDLAGNKIEDPPKFCIGVAASPGMEPLEVEILRLERKAKLKPDFIQTQSVYDIEVIKTFMREVERLHIPVIVGLTPIRSVGMLDYLVKNVPGIKIPEEIQQRLRKAREISKEKLYEENIEIFSEIIREIRRTTKAAGIHMMAVYFEWIIPKILEVAGIKLEHS